MVNVLIRRAFGTDSFIFFAQEFQKKRMSLPANLNLLPELYEKPGRSPTSPFQNMSRSERRVSLVS